MPVTTPSGAAGPLEHRPLLDVHLDVAAGKRPALDEMPGCRSTHAPRPGTRRLRAFARRCRRPRLPRARRRRRAARRTSRRRGRCPGASPSRPPAAPAAIRSGAPRRFQPDPTRPRDRPPRIHPAASSQACCSASLPPGRFAPRPSPSAYSRRVGRVPVSLRPPRPLSGQIVDSRDGPGPARGGRRQALRARPGARRGQPGSAARRARGPARTERGGEVDPRQDRLRADSRVARPRGDLRSAGGISSAPAPRSATSPSSSASRAGTPPTRCCASTSDSSRSPGGDGERGAAARARRARERPRACGSMRCPRGCSSGSGSRRRSSGRRRCCCSTSRRARSTRPAGEPSAHCSRSCATGRSASSSTRIC